MKKRILSKYASGYNLYSWANNVLPDDSVTLIYHRSYYFAEKNILYFGIPVFTGNSDINSRKYHLNKVKQKSQIIFYSMVMMRILILINLILKIVFQNYF